MLKPVNAPIFYVTREMLARKAKEQWPDRPAEMAVEKIKRCAGATRPPPLPVLRKARTQAQVGLLTAAAFSG